MGDGPQLPDGLIGPPPAHPTGARAFVGAWFLALTGGLGIWDALDPPRLPDPIGQEGVHFRDRRRTARIDDGTRMRIVDEDLERRSNLKSRLAPWYAGVLLSCLDEGGAEVVVGRDGWLFLETRVHPPEADLDTVARTWANAFAALDRQLARRSSRLVVMPIPRRAVACREWLPDAYDPGPGLLDPFCEALVERGIDTLDLRAPFAEHVPSELFYREDTHWSRTAQFVAARAAREHLDSFAGDPVAASLGSDDQLGPDKQGLLTFAGLPIGAPARDALFPADRSPARAPRDRRVGRVPGPTSAPLVLIGTSFSVGEHFLAYLRMLGTTPVRNGARKGFPTWDSLRSDLQAQRAPTATVLVEMLTHAMGPNLVRAGELTYMGNQFGFLTALEGRRGPSVLPADAVTEMPAPLGVRRLELGPGRLLTTADGVVSMRLQRPVASTDGASAGAWNVVVRGGGLTWGTRWSADRESLHLPLIATSPGAHAFTVDLRGAGVEDMHARDVRCVLEHDLAAAATLTPGDLEEGTNGTRTRDFALQGSLGDDLALDYLQGNWSGEVCFELIGAQDSPGVEIARGHLEAHGRAVLDLASFAGRPWTALRVTTTAVRRGPGRARDARASLVPLRAE